MQGWMQGPYRFLHLEPERAQVGWLREAILCEWIYLGEDRLPLLCRQMRCQRC
jgi:hypothetical protein